MNHIISMIIVVVGGGAVVVVVIIIIKGKAISTLVRRVNLGLIVANEFAFRITI